MFTFPSLKLAIDWSDITIRLTGVCWKPFSLPGSTDRSNISQLVISKPTMGNFCLISRGALSQLQEALMLLIRPGLWRTMWWWSPCKELLHHSPLNSLSITKCLHHKKIKKLNTHCHCFSPSANASYVGASGCNNLRTVAVSSVSPSLNQLLFVSSVLENKYFAV